VVSFTSLLSFYPSISTLGSQSISSEMGLFAPKTSSDIFMSFTTGVTVSDDSGAYNQERSDRTTGPLLCGSTSLNSSPSNLSGTVSSVSVPGKCPTVTGLSVAWADFPPSLPNPVTRMSDTDSTLLPSSVQSVTVSRPTLGSVTSTQSRDTSICSTGMQLTQDTDVR